LESMERSRLGQDENPINGPNKLLLQELQTLAGIISNISRTRTTCHSTPVMKRRGLLSAYQVITFRLLGTVGAYNENFAG